MRTYLLAGFLAIALVAPVAWTTGPAVSDGPVAVDRSAAAGGSGNGSSPNGTTTVAWRAPSGFAGNVTVGWRVDVDAGQQCTVDLRWDWNVNGPNPVAFVASTWGPNRSHSYVAGYNPEVVRLQAGGADTSEARHRIAVRADQDQSATIPISSKTEAVAVSVFDVRPDGDDAPVAVELSCPDPFDVRGLVGGTGGVSWTETTMEGGTTAAVEVGAQAKVLIDNRQPVHLDEERVRYSVSLDTDGIRSQGEAVLERPDGPTRSWDLQDTWLWASGAGPSGTWTFRADLRYAEDSSFSPILGWIVPAERVDDGAGIV